jgi:hypothetical protein
LEQAHLELKSMFAESNLNIEGYKCIFDLETLTRFRKVCDSFKDIKKKLKY